MNINLTEETIRISKEIFKKFPQEIGKSITETVKYNNVINLDFPKKEYKECKIEVVFDDTADIGYKLLNEGYDPVILNMASHRRPGGGWRKGACAQEESLFYRSTYYLALEDPMKLNPKSSSYYPLNNFSVIYTPNVHFFRARQLDGYSILSEKERCFLPCIASAALANPELNNGKYFNQDRDIMVEKIKGIFKVALKHSHDAIVVGAYGCGAFKNPPEEVAKIFKEVLQEYKKYFKHIAFAILDYRGSNNYEIFKEIILE